MRARPLALAGLAVGAVLALVAGSRSWWRASGTGVDVGFSGTETTAGLAQALALVVLAGALLGLVLRARGRRVLGVLLALAGAGAVVVGLDRPRPASGTVESRVLEVSLADQFALVGTAWPFVYAAAGALVLAAALLMAVTAPRWPTRAARFERPGQEGQAGSTPSARSDDPATLWRSLDRGVDPTLDPTPDQGPAPSAQGGRADVHDAASGVTMNPRASARTDEPT
ncbi:trp region conserved hypothetical membrane protein [Microlunatus sagamiharensis]|uniref:Trp region conserved hypothetical membrane protein n=1 Tax=Microlunatus sagamiharensis TaxID=546874 RepID=A0A1H2M7S1_9ACTN|nr:Trp biosynthesis-associated membrane protein [Microlunatus sagamiharensis]SDU89317.1 trp region conserved hypothetical membrane protein [Microlunatus sagamiharensis]